MITTKTNINCPFCNTYLMQYTRDRSLYFCECHPLKNYKDEKQRLFSWRLNWKFQTWEHIPKDSDKWTKFIKKVPKIKQVFTFR